MRQMKCELRESAVRPWFDLCEISANLCALCGLFHSPTDFTAEHRSDLAEISSSVDFQFFDSRYMISAQTHHEEKDNEFPET
jgi:hypothetical protein